jgi:hypothetical protein
VRLPSNRTGAAIEERERGSDEIASCLTQITRAPGLSLR